jgi:hypothetical protein
LRQCFGIYLFAHEFDTFSLEFYDKGLKERLHVDFESCKLSALNCCFIVKRNSVFSKSRLQFFCEDIEIISAKLFIADIQHSYWLQGGLIGLFFGNIDELFQAEGGEMGVELWIVAAVMIGKPEPWRYLTGYHFLIIFLSELRDSLSVYSYLGLGKPFQNLSAVHKPNYSTPYHRHILKLPLKMRTCKIYCFYCAARCQ